MENNAHAVATGFFVLLLAAALGACALWLGGGTIHGVPYDLVTEADVAGLSAGTPVRLEGVQVGEIQRIDFDPSDPRHVRVRALIRPDVHLFEGTRATIRYLGLSGTGYVELEYPQGLTRTLQTSLTSPAKIPLRDSGLPQLTEAANKLVSTFTMTLGRVNAVLTPETARNLSRLIANLNDAAAGMAVLTHSLEPAAHRADSVLRNANGLMRSVRSTAKDADTLVVDVGAHGGAIDAVREGALETGAAARHIDDALVYETLPRVDALIERLSRASDSLNQVLHQMSSEPQSLIFGLPPRAPGPGEPGFKRLVDR